jgi:hypothetical protein
MSPSRGVGGYVVIALLIIILAAQASYSYSYPARGDQLEEHDQYTPDYTPRDSQDYLRRGGRRQLVGLDLAADGSGSPKCFPGTKLSSNKTACVSLTNDDVVRALHAVADPPVTTCKNITTVQDLAGKVH